MMFLLFECKLKLPRAEGCVVEAFDRVAAWPVPKFQFIVFIA